MKRQPRVLHVIDHTGDGGAQIVIRDLVRALKDRFAFGVAVLGRSDHFSDDYEALGIPVYKLGDRYNRWNPAPIAALINLIRRERFDLIHTQLFKSNILGTIAATITGRKTILHDQVGMYPQSLQHYFSSNLIKNSYLTAYRYALSRSDRAIVLTPGTLQAYTQYYGVAAQKIVVMPNAVDTQHFSPISGAIAASSLRAELGLPDETRLILMIGRLEPEKDWWTFLEVARRVQAANGSCAFLIVGGGSEDQRLREYVRAQHLDHVRFLGYRSNVIELLHQADVFLMTSRREPFGIVVVEAMAAGCPVVATRSGGPDSILTDGVDGLLADVADAPVLADRVVRLLCDDGLRNRIVQCARRTVVEHYSLEAIAERIAQVYTETLSA
jgi:glycosyltransferase involved in cell wall biosynthesis